VPWEEEARTVLELDSLKAQGQRHIRPCCYNVKNETSTVSNHVSSSKSLWQQWLCFCYVPAKASFSNLLCCCTHGSIKYLNRHSHSRNLFPDKTFRSRVAANILNKQLWTADKECSYDIYFGRGAKKSSP